MIATIGAFIPRLFGKTPSYQTAKTIGFFIVGIPLLIALLGLGKCAYDRSVVNAYKAKVEAAASENREKAGDERLTDERTNSKNEEDLHNAINSAPPSGTISAADHALNCERLRKRGRAPASCGPASSGGTKAGSQ